MPLTPPRQSKYLKALQILRQRPLKLWQYGRGYVLFQLSNLLRPLLLDNVRIHVANNVRIQNLASFLAAGSDSLIEVGQDSIIYENAHIEVYGAGRLSIGAGSILGDVRIYCRNRVQLGERCLISWNVVIQDYDPHPPAQQLRRQQMQEMARDFLPKFGSKIDVNKPNLGTPSKQLWEPPSAPIEIGEDVWIGTGAIILKGAKIGTGSIIAAGSVVLGGEFPERSLIGGNPAKFIKVLPE